MSLHNNHHSISGRRTTNNITSIIENFENGSYLRQNADLLQESIRKIDEFSRFINGGLCRISLLTVRNHIDNELLIQLLINLKKDLKSAIASVGKSLRYKRKTITCNLCKEVIVIEPTEDFWSVLQKHEHFEQLLTYQDLVANSESSYSSVSDEPVPSTSSTSPEAPIQNGLLKKKQQQPEPPVFKFNFANYDRFVEDKLYPDGVKGAARKHDKLAECSVQRCGPNRAKCLLCPCVLIGKGKGKMGNYNIANHTAGKQHLKQALDPKRLESLQRYHDFWKRQEAQLQTHQIYFVPYITSVYCDFCTCHVGYDNVVNHLNEQKHKDKMVKFLKAADAKAFDPQLIDKQAGFYGVPRPERSTSESSSSKEPEKKCIITKLTQISTTLEDLLPQRYKQHTQFLKKSGNNYSCEACKVKLGANVKNVRKHVQSAEHRQATETGPHKYRYYCEICNYHFTDEFSWEGHFTLGPNNHANIPVARKETLGEYECTTCLLVIYGDEISVTRHIATIGNGRNKKKEIRLPPAVVRLFNTKEAIEFEGGALKGEANEVLNKTKNTTDCCKCLEEAVSEIYPNCKAYPFGSRMSGLGNNRSDLDIFMDVGDMYTGERYQDGINQEKFVTKCRNVFRKQKGDFKDVLGIPSARTPIVKLHHIFTQLDCDISFRHGLGVENTKFLRFCVELQPITQPFILLLKKWSDFCNLNEHITNYGLALMAVFFLQINGYLLSVTRLRNFNPTESLIIDGWETINYTVPVDVLRDHVEPYEGDLKLLLEEFFFYYSEFNHSSDVLCPLLGYTIPKSLFTENSENLPPEMHSYAVRVQQENGETFRALSELCLQDPFDLSHNLTKACQIGVVNNFKTLCKLTYEHLINL